MNFLQIVFDVDLLSQQEEDLLVAYLNNYGFDSFEHKKKNLYAYIPDSGFKMASLERYLAQYLDVVILKVNKLEDQNWNEIWESSFAPVFVNDNCVVRAPFHDLDIKDKIDIIINPKMSFGTGHHETTMLMMKSLFKINLHEQSVLDIGSGTGILSILASKIGAQSIYAIDIDINSYVNSKENILLNKCNNILVFKTSIIDFNHKALFNVILANINRNVLLSELHQYIKRLKENGILILSGFLESDFLIINKKAIGLGVKFQNRYEENNWQCVVYIK